MNANEIKAWALSLPSKIRNLLDLSFDQEAVLEKFIDDELSRLAAIDD